MVITKNNFILKSSRFSGCLKIIALGIVLLVSSCTQKKFSNETDLLAYLKTPENGYVQNKTINGIAYNLMYRPTDLLVKQELGDTKPTDSIIHALREKYNKYLYFNLSMSQNNQELLNAKAGNKNEFGAMVNQLVFGMGQKVHFYTKSKDTLELVDFVYPRMYGMSKATTIMFVYPREEKALQEEQLNFTIEDLGFYTGEVKFKIASKQLNNEPQLAF